MNQIRHYECSQCGGTEFEDSGIQQVRCSHCGSLFKVLTDEPRVVTNKDARVVFGKSANVEIRGDMEVEDGADVDIQGKVILVKGKKKQKFTLELIQKG